MVNGKENCAEEMKTTVEICPTWCQEDMAERKRFDRKVLLIQKAEYDRAMAPAPYNEGRTVADISNKTYIHGTRKYLRPDTLWADERYVDVTPEEAKEAKVRHEQVLKETGQWNTPLKPAHIHSNTHIGVKHEAPLY